MTARFGALLLVSALGASCSVVQYGGGSRAGDADGPGPSRTTAARTQPAAWNELGRSVEGRPIRMRRVGAGPRRVIWIGGIHGNEPEGSVATDELPAAFASRVGLAEAVTLTIVEDLNPDGRAAGTRGNSRGVDLNRNYPSQNYASGDSRGPAALSEPESRALHELILQLDPHLVIVAHSWGRKPEGPPCFVNFDGPAEHLAQAFGRISGYAVVPSEDIHGTPGSLGSFVGIDRRIPILTIEYERGRDRTRCWDETRDAILAVISGESVSLGR